MKQAPPKKGCLSVRGLLRRVHAAEEGVEGGFVPHRERDGFLPAQRSLSRRTKITLKESLPGKCGARLSPSRFGLTAEESRGSIAGICSIASTSVEERGLSCGVCPFSFLSCS